jgi:hypothetical protein
MARVLQLTSNDFISPVLDLATLYPIQPPSPVSSESQRIEMNQTNSGLVLILTSSKQ